MKKLSFVVLLLITLGALKAQNYRVAEKRIELFNTNDNLINTVDMDLESGLAQIGYIRPGFGSLSNIPTNSNTATRMHFTHFSDYVPTTTINKLIMPSSENPYFLDDNKKYFPKEIKKISGGYIVCGYFEGCPSRGAFLMKTDNSGSPTLYKEYVNTVNGDYTVLNSVAAITDGFVACGYKWDNTNSRKKAIIMTANSSLTIVNAREVNEGTITVPQLGTTRYPSSYYNKIEADLNGELFLIGACGVVTTTTSSTPDGVAYYTGDVLFARCSTVFSPAFLQLTAVNLFSNFTDVVELGVALKKDNGAVFANTDYVLLIDRIDDQFNGSQFTSRTSNVVIEGMFNVHTNNYNNWLSSPIESRFDYQNTNLERGVDLTLENDSDLYMLCSYDGVVRPIESQIFPSGTGRATTNQGDDYTPAAGGIYLVPRDLETDANGRKILAHGSSSPYVEKINPLYYDSMPGMPHCQGFYHQVIVYDYSINKGTFKTFITPTYNTCEIAMKGYEIPMTILNPCMQQPKTQQDEEGNVPDKKGTGNQLADVKVYPNPAGNKITLEFTDVLAPTSTLEVIGINGQVVASMNTTEANGNLINVDISTLADGVYFCRVTAENGTQLQTRFQKVTAAK